MNFREQEDLIDALESFPSQPITSAGYPQKKRNAVTKFEKRTVEL